MTQKELNYIEDVINHERLIIAALENNQIDDEKYVKKLQDQIETHQTMVNKLMNLLGGDK